jgi:hypothetical protein
MGAADATARPDLVVSSVTQSVTSVAPGASLTLTEVTKNIGTARPRRGTTTRFYLSMDKLRSSGDKVLASVAVPRLAVRAKSTGTKLVTIPAATTTRSYYVIACADATKVVTESREGNNCRSGSALTVSAPAGADVGPNQDGRDKLLAAAGPMKLLSSPPATSTRTAASTFQDAESVTKIIDAAGGTIAVQDTAGDQITLTIPAHALLGAVAITATPVDTTSGAAAAGERPIGLKLEPSGLGLLQQAVMTVTPFTGGTDRKVEGMISASDGSDVNPEMVFPDTSKIAMPVNHFTVITALVSDGNGGTTTQYFTQTEYTATLHNAVVRAVESVRDGAVDNGPIIDVNGTIVAASNAYWNNVALPLLTQSETSCTFAKANLITVLEAVHEDAVLGITRPAWSPSYAKSLQNCWKEETTACMTMVPSRYSGLIALAREMAIQGVTTSAGTEPDPFNVTWCGDINGYINITRQENMDLASNGTSVVTRDGTHAVVWFSATALKWWNSDGTFTLTAGSDNPPHSTSDIVADYTDNETWPQTPGTPSCIVDWSAHSVLSQAPTGASLDHRSFSPTTGAATASQGLSVAGWPVQVPAPDGTLTGSDSCSQVTTTQKHIFNWSGPLTNQQFNLSVDTTKGDITTHWDHTDTDGDGYTHSIHYVIEADLHVNGLKDFIAAGHP